VDKRGYLDGTEYGYRRGLADGRGGNPKRPVSSVGDLVANLLRPKAFLESYVKGYGRGYEEGIRTWRKEAERREFGNQAVRGTAATTTKTEEPKDVDIDPARDAELGKAFAGAKVELSVQAKRSMASGLAPETVSACVAKANAYMDRLEARGQACNDPAAVYARAISDRWDIPAAKRDTSKAPAGRDGRELSPGRERER
jgi:hypothetical protein